MERLLDQVEIYSISWDTPTATFTYRKGQKVGKGKDLKIVKIARNEAHYHMFGNICYMIYVEVEGEPRIWRMLENKPMDVVFDI